MTLLAPLGLLAGLLAIPVVALHVLRPQRERQAVSSTLLWKAVEQPVAPSRPWQRLRWSIPLILQLLLVALLALALAQPARVVQAGLADHTVFIVDTSASMLASDGDPDRVEAATDRTRELLDDLPAGGSMSLVVASSDPELVVLDTTDRGAFERELDRVRPSAGVADFVEAFTLAESAVSSDRSTGWILLSDGGVGLDAQRLAPPGLRYEAIGVDDVNRSISALSVVVEDGELSALVTMSNSGGPDATQELRVDVDNATVARREVVLPSGQTVELRVPIPPGSRVEAFLEGDDLLLIDNQRAALVPLATDLRVRISSDDPDGAFFIEEVLDAMGATIVRSAVDADLIVYDGVAVPTDPPAPFISIATPQPPSGVSLIGEVERPIPTFIADDVVLRDVDVTGTAIASAQLLDAGDATVLIGSAEGEPLLIDGRTGNTRWYHLAFELERSNLPVEVAYPILFSRMVGDLTISDEVPASAVVGTRLPTITSDAVVTGPRGVATSVPAGSPMPVLDTSGFWTVESGEGEIRPVAVVFPSAESALSVASGLEALVGPTGPTDGADDGATRVEPIVESLGSTTRSIVVWLIAAALLVALVELLVGWRRHGVPRTQLVAARVIRAVIVLALIAALADVEWRRSNDDVRAVLVVDVSDSLGDEGLRLVEAFADNVLDGEVDDIAIVEVGRTVQVSKPFDTGSGRIVADPPGDGTDLVRGLRLASSLLDGSTRERIVVVSDGLDTNGDLSAEARRLAEIGIRLDAHTIDVARGADVAVVSVTAPSRVSIDEAYRVNATIFSDDARPVTVELVRNDGSEATRSVDLAAGENDVVFDVTAADAGLDRFDVRVLDATDAVVQNDSASTAVAVEGPPKVLIVEADDGEGDLVASALAARAIEVEQTSVTEFPSVDELATFGSVVLVDIEARELGEAHLDALDTHVRDQGNGLVVVGGTESFALGGYAETRLEDLLPIESRAEDPTRKATVAEVLLIDASESMGTCHCAPIEGAESDDPFAGQSMEGGVNKTDISRAAAERAIAALSADDEVGVLAFSGNHDWIVPLQDVGSATATAAEELLRLTPSGETRISPALDEAANALRNSSKELKHIILFSDGFTPELFDDGNFGFDPSMESASFSDMEDQAKALADEGITVSVVATGEGAAPLLESIALAGNGRFYPGRDLEEIPEIFVEEARIASRSFINEGEYVPVVTSTAAPVRGLDAAPAIAGFLAGTPKPTADVMLQVGEFADPLLSSWRVGLGKVTAWTSDAGDRWAASWATWDGWADFWSTMVRDTFPLDGASGHRVSADIRGESLFLELASESSWPAGAAPIATVTGPDGEATEVQLDRVDDTTFSAALPAVEAGSYSVAASIADGPDSDTSSRLATAVATRSYPTEYLPQPTRSESLSDLSELTEGRGEITASQVLDADGLSNGSTAKSLRWILILIAALLFPLDLALHRVRFATLVDDVRSSRRLRATSLPPRATPTA